MTDTPTHSVSVAGAVFDLAGRALAICRRDTGAWELPGGVLELDETLDTGVQREVLEETGLIVSVQRLRGVYKNMTAGIISLVYRCAVVGGTMQPTVESQRTEWLTLNEVQELMTPAFAIRILDAAPTNGPVMSRVHDGTNLL